METLRAASVMAEELSYIADLVRRDDRDRYATAMFMPPSVRADALTLFALNIQLAEIREHVSENMIGRIKLHWWRDVIAGIYDGKGAPQGNPVTESLLVCIQRHQLDRAHFDAMLDTREKDMSDVDEGPRTVADLENYAEGTASKLLRLTLTVLGAHGAESHAAAKHAGIAFALAGLMRAVLFHAAENRLYMPHDVLAKAGLSGVQDVQIARNAPVVARIVAEIAGVAHAHIGQARARKPERAAIPALLLATIAEQHLNRLKRVGYNLNDVRIANTRLGVGRLMWNAWWGQY